jgi:amino acid permease
MSVHDLGAMLSILGATGSTLVIFILPGVCYYLLHKDGRTKKTVANNNTADIDDSMGEIDLDSCRQLGDDSATNNNTEQPQWKLFAALGMAALGVVLMPVCLVALLFL